MINKKNLKQSFKSFLTKKIFSENCYQKSYVRKNFLDNNKTLYNYQKSLETGFSVLTKTYTYSHVYNNKFTFNSFLNKKNLQTKNFVYNFYNSLLTLKKNFKNYFFLLKPIKGGFYAYFSGVIGFIPLRNILYFSEKFFLKIKYECFFLLLYNFIDIDSILKFFRIYVVLITFKMVLFGKYKNFSKVKKVKSRRFFFNSVFLLKKNSKQIFSSNEIK